MLIPPKNSLQAQGLRSPEDFYWVLQDPVPLAGMCLPETNWPWQSIHDCGFDNLVSLHPMEHDPTPLTSVYSLPLEDLVHGDPPKNPLLEISKIRSATRTILQSLSDCEGVVVHCWGGRGRTGTVLGCVLRELGYEGETVVKYLDEIQRVRGRKGWPEAVWQSEIVRKWPDV